MARTPPPTPGDDPYAPPPDLDGPPPAPAPPSGRRLGLRLAVLAALAVVAAGALIGYRIHHRRAVLAAGMAQAEALLRLDTARGHREAADLLEPLAGLDPLEAGSMRAFALAMLAADYREPGAAAKAEALLLEPERADQVPAWANLANAALQLGRRAVGDATTFALRARGNPWSGVLQARLALLAGNPEAGLEPVAAAAARDPQLAAARAVQGDLARRGRRDAVAARGDYLAALGASPLHPRATYGLAKLALAAQIPQGEATGPLERLAGDAGTPTPERARAALYLAALRRRAGDPAAAEAILAAAPLDQAARDWAAKASAVLADERGPYRAVLGAPATIVSPSDDDPASLAPVPPAPPPPPEPPRVAPPPKQKAPPAKAGKASAKGGTKGTAKPKASTKAKAKSGRTTAR